MYKYNLYHSMSYETFMDGEYKKMKENLYLDIQEKEDYMINVDVSSLYPTAMIKYEYPIGKRRKSKNQKEEFETNIQFMKQ